MGKGKSKPQAPAAAAPQEPSATVTDAGAPDESNKAIMRTVATNTNPASSSPLASGNPPSNALLDDPRRKTEQGATNSLLG